ncbi:MAG: hypothetical protein K2Q14_04795 [Gammaproteobacteria bacterium]|nr:hypothetical protein [Gammaproteobacteria bacterium]
MTGLTVTITGLTVTSPENVKKTKKISAVTITGLAVTITWLTVTMENDVKNHF